MKTQAALFTSFVLLVSCGPLSMYYRTGVTVTRQQTDLTECEVAALRDAPVANQIRQGPPVFYPGDRYCNRGHCWRTGGYWESGPLYSVDVNKGLRTRVTDMCMAKRGYQPVTIQPCGQSIKSAAPAARTTTLPRLQANSCFIRNQDKSIQIVTPGIASSGN